MANLKIKEIPKASLLTCLITHKSKNVFVCHSFLAICDCLENAVKKSMSTTSKVNPCLKIHPPSSVQVAS